MTNAERREKRREAGLKGAATRRARSAPAEPAQIAPHQVEPPQLVPATIEPTRLETAEEKARREQAREAKRLENLRAVLRRAQEIRRESDLYHLAHVRKWHHCPKRWTPEQIDEARKFVEGFIRPDGTPQADPIRRKGRWRL
jgi:hypothetical protein